MVHLVPLGVSGDLGQGDNSRFWAVGTYLEAGIEVTVLLEFTSQSPGARRLQVNGKIRELEILQYTQNAGSSELEIVVSGDFSEFGGVVCAGLAILGTGFGGVLVTVPDSPIASGDLRAIEGIKVFPTKYFPRPGVRLIRRGIYELSRTAFAGSCDLEA